MRKLCLLVCCALLMQMLCSCAPKKEEFIEPVNFYYANSNISYNSPMGVIQPEVHEGSGFYDNLLSFLGAYLQGPTSSELKRLIPTDIYIVSCRVESDCVNLVMSSQFSNLSGIKLTAACSALLMTIHDYTGMEALKISAKDAHLDDKSEIILRMDDLVLIDSVEKS